MADSAFFEEVQESIWLLKFEYKEKNEMGELEDMAIFGTGFALTSNGLIMSAAHLVPSDPGYQITARRKNDSSFFKVKLLDCRPECDVSLLKIKGIKNCKYRNFAGDGSVSIGEEVIHIGHPNDMVWSLIKGRVAYPCKEPDVHLPLPHLDNLQRENYVHPCETTSPYRRFQDICKQNSEKKSQKHPRTPLVQMNFLCGSGSSGGPVFNVKKEIIGMHSFFRGGQSFAIHVSLLKHVLLDFENTGTSSKRKSKKSRHSSRSRKKRRIDR